MRPPRWRPSASSQSIVSAVPTPTTSAALGASRARGEQGEETIDAQARRLRIGDLDVAEATLRAGQRDPAATRRQRIEQARRAARPARRWRRRRRRSVAGSTRRHVIGKPLAVVGKGDDLADSARRHPAARTSAACCRDRTASELMRARTLTSPAWKLRVSPSASRTRNAPSGARPRAVPARSASPPWTVTSRPASASNAGVARQEGRAGRRDRTVPAPAAASPAAPPRSALRDGSSPRASVARSVQGWSMLRACACRHAHVEAEPDHRAHRTGMFAAALDQQAAELAQAVAVGDDEVVRPFQAHALDARATAALRPRRRRPPGSVRRAARGRRRSCAPATGTGWPPAAKPRCARAARARRSGVRPAGRATPARGGSRRSSSELVESIDQATSSVASRARTAGGKRRADRVGIEQVERSRQRVAAPGPRLDLDAGLAQGFDALPDRGAGLAVFARQARRRTPGPRSAVRAGRARRSSAAPLAAIDGGRHVADRRPAGGGHGRANSVLQHASIIRDPARRCLRQPATAAVSGLLRRSMQPSAVPPHPRYSPLLIAASGPGSLMSTRLALCLFLLCASFPLMARDVRMMSANGDSGGGTCQDDSTAPATTPRCDRHPPSPRRACVKPVKAKPGMSHSARQPRRHPSAALAQLPAGHVPLSRRTGVRVCVD